MRPPSLPDPINLPLSTWLHNILLDEMSKPDYRTMLVSVDCLMSCQQQWQQSYGEVLQSSAVLLLFGHRVYTEYKSAQLNISNAHSYTNTL